MTFNVKKITDFIFPLIAIVGVSLSLFNFWLVKHVQISLTGKLERSENTQSNVRVSYNSDKDQHVLGEITAQSAEEVQKQHEQENKDLKDRSLEFSPNKSKIAFFQNKFTEDLKSLGDSDYVSVIVEQNGKEKKVFQEDYHLSYLEWLDDREIVVYRSCGTECMIAYIIDTETKQQQELTLGVGYTWSPNKQYVAVYHYSLQYGISIANRGNQYGQTIFQLRRKHPPDGSGLANQTRVAWSLDSTKLAVVIRKENEEKLELLVFDIQKDFEIFYRQDLDSTNVSNLVWEGQSKILITDNMGDKRISLEK